MAWVLVILLVFVSITNILVETKDIKGLVKGVFSSSNSEEILKIDVKTTLALWKNSQSREAIEMWVKNEP